MIYLYSYLRRRLAVLRGGVQKQEMYIQPVVAGALFRRCPSTFQILPQPMGETYIRGALRSRNIYIPRWRVREALQTIDPVNRAVRRKYAIQRRLYNVRNQTISGILTLTTNSLTEDSFCTGVLTDTAGL